MDGISLWVPKKGTVWRNVGDPVEYVTLPKHCPQCGSNSAFILAYEGTDQEPGAYAIEDCTHWFNWEEMWKLIGSTGPGQDTPLTTRKAKPVAVIGRCRSCGDSNPWAEIDDHKTNTYCCYSCKQSGYK